MALRLNSRQLSVPTDTIRTGVLLGLGGKGGGSTGDRTSNGRRQRTSAHLGASLEACEQERDQEFHPRADGRVRRGSRSGVRNRRRLYGLSQSSSGATEVSPDVRRRGMEGQPARTSDFLMTAYRKIDVYVNRRPVVQTYLEGHSLWSEASYKALRPRVKHRGDCDHPEIVRAFAY